MRRLEHGLGMERMETVLGVEDLGGGWKGGAGWRSRRSVGGEAGWGQWRIPMGTVGQLARACWGTAGSSATGGTAAGLWPQ